MPGFVIYITCSGLPTVETGISSGPSAHVELVGCQERYLVCKKHSVTVVLRVFLRRSLRDQAFRGNCEKLAEMQKSIVDSSARAELLCAIQNQMKPDN